ncbi:MAG: ATP-binding cassette domain-containing protein [Firmicutes bacterium]|nr:ATP-binding cassette domain-containing protein [Bacillota bacterium]
MKIEVKSVSKEFEGVSVLQDVSMTLEEGNIYGFIGRNGSGKSVLLKMICSLYEPTSGEILFDGVNVIKEKNFPPSTRALIEKPCFLPDLSGFENLELLANIQGKIGKEEIENSLKQVNLFDEKDKKYSKYSLGMKQKLGIAQVLMEDPKIMILDEPLNGIEEETANKLRDILIEEKNKGKIIIVASHIKEDIEKLADIVYHFDGGRVKLEKS